MKSTPDFRINIAKKPKPVVKDKSVGTVKVSRLCLATVILDDGQFKAKVNLLNDPDYPEHIIINFTKESLNLNNKHIIYKKEKDELNHIVQIIRDDISVGVWHPDPNVYSTVQENLCVSGNIVRTFGELQFNLLGIHGFANNPQDLPVRLDNTRPLFQ